MKKKVLTTVVFLIMQSTTYTDTLPTTTDSSDDWFTTLMNSLNTTPSTPASTQPTEVSTPSIQPQTPTALAQQVTELSTADLRTFLNALSGRLTVEQPAGNSKQTVAFLTGLAQAITTLSTVITDALSNKELAKIPGLRAWLRYQLLQLAALL